MSIQRDNVGDESREWKLRNSKHRNTYPGFLAFEVGGHCDFRIEQPGDWTILLRLFRSFVESSLISARDLGLYVEMDRRHSEPRVSFFER